MVPDEIVSLLTVSVNDLFEEIFQVIIHDYRRSAGDAYAKPCLEEVWKLLFGEGESSSKAALMIDDLAFL